MSDDATIFLSGTCWQPWQQHTKCECAQSDRTVQGKFLVFRLCVYVTIAILANILEYPGWDTWLTPISYKTCRMCSPLQLLFYLSSQKEWGYSINIRNWWGCTLELGHWLDYSMHVKMQQVPPAQWDFQRIPGRKPGTSTKVMMGILKASQKRTKRAPFTEELMSKQPDKWDRN